MARKSMKKSMKKRGGGQCGAPLMGGNRRTRSRRMRGGMYGFNGGVITPGTLEAGAAYTGAADPKTGAAIPDPTLKGTPSEGSYTGIGGRRRTRKSRKGSKKTRKMKGGGAGVNTNQISAQKAGWGYGGNGVAGLITPEPAPTSGGNAF